MKKWYASKTLWFNVLAFIVALASAFGYTGELATDWMVFVPAIAAIINIVLRFLTKEPLA